MYSAVTADGNVELDAGLAATAANALAAGELRILSAGYDILDWREREVAESGRRPSGAAS